MPATWNDLTDDERCEVRELHARLLQPEFQRTIGLAMSSVEPRTRELAAEFERWTEPEAMIDSALLPRAFTLTVAESPFVPDEIGKTALVLVAPEFRSNATADKLRSGRPLIILSFGMCMSGYFGPTTFFEYIHNELTEARGRALAAIVATARAVQQNDVFFLDAVWQLIPKPTRERDAIARLSVATTGFILAHEFGHHALRHAPTQDNAKSQQQEYEADQFAFKLCSFLAPTAELLHAIGIHFQLMHICEALDDTKAGTTHPLWIDRWKALSTTSEPAAAFIVSLVNDVMGDAIAACKGIEPEVNQLRGLFPFRD